jgi:molybdopterin-dependent oxidoreductase alpha subunit
MGGRVVNHGKDRVRVQPPDDAADVSVTPRDAVAGGLGAIRETMHHAVGHMGVVRSAVTLFALNQKDGFDCPGCAWPDPDEERTSFEFCENGAKAVASEATKRTVDASFFREHSLAELSEKSDMWLNDLGRLVEPLVLRPGSAYYEPLGYDEAFALLARHLSGLPSPDRAVFYTSGRTSNEAAFLYQLFVRAFGTNNLPDCSNMCHESSGTGLKETIGVGKGTVTLRDFELADAIFVVGQNPGTNHPRMLTTLLHAARRGCTIVSVNPLPETGLARFKHPQEAMKILGAGEPLARLHLPVRVNGDVAFFKGLMKEMLEEESRRPGTVLDHAFIEEHTDGFAAFRDALAGVGWDDIVRESGLSRASIRAAARIAMESRATIVTWAMGLTQHKNAVGNIQEIVNFLLLRGNIGRPGAGACPVRGHSNVQGDRTMGIWEKPDPGFLDRLGARFGFEPPRRHGKDTVDAIRAMDAGEIDVFFAMGGNLLSAAPDTERTARALRRCALTAHVSTKLNRGHLVTGKTALILPCLGRTEKDVGPLGARFVTVENSMGVVHTSRGRLEPASAALKSEPDIVADLARATFRDRSPIPWEWLVEDYDRIRDAIAEVVAGCEDYNARVRHPGGFYLENAARDRRFRTATGKARFTVHPLPRLELGPGQLLMTTIRSHDQYNTTVYGLEDRYRGVHGGRRVVFANAQDLAELGIEEGELVDLVSHFEGEERTAEGFKVVVYPIPRGCAATYFPEANVLVALDSVAEKSNTPASKSVVISLRRRRD